MPFLPGAKPIIDYETSPGGPNGNRPSTYELHPLAKTKVWAPI